MLKPYDPVNAKSAFASSGVEIAIKEIRHHPWLESAFETSMAH